MYIKHKSVLNKGYFWCRSLWCFKFNKNAKSFKLVDVRMEFHTRRTVFERINLDGKLTKKPQYAFEPVKHVCTCDSRALSRPSKYRLQLTFREFRCISTFGLRMRNTVLAINYFVQRTVFCRMFSMCVKIKGSRIHPFQ